MALSSKPNTSSYQIRSISFPCRLHPIICKIEDQLAEFRQASSLPMPLGHAQSVSGLASGYKCVEELLHLPMTQQVFFRYRNGKLVDELLDESIGVLDICDITKGMVSQIKEHARHLLCVIRRRKGDSSSIESSIANYICFRKKIKKDATRLIGNMKQVCKVGGSLEADQDDHLVAVIRVVTEVCEMTILIFESLFVFFSVKPKQSRWSIVSKVMHKGRVACEDHQQENANDNLESLDAALLNLCRNGSGNEVRKKIQMAQIQLEAMEGYIESIENGLDCLFRHLVKTRALLLNILSH